MVSSESSYRGSVLTIVSGFFISAVVFYALNVMFPIPDMDQMDVVDVYGTFTAAEARRVGVATLEEDSSAFGITGISIEPVVLEKDTTGEKRV